MIFRVKKWYIFTIIIGIILIIGLSQLSSSSYAFFDRHTIEQTTTPHGLYEQKNNSNIKDLKIAFLTDSLFSDAGWGAFGYNAARALEKKYGYGIDFKENVAIPDIEITLREYANAGHDLIIAFNFIWGAPAIKVAKDYPNTKFVIFTGLVNSTNVASIFPMQQEGTYLLGALAAMMSKTNVIGFIGGEKYPNLINILEGYKQGAKEINPNIRVLSTFLNDWDSPIKGKEAALAQINNDNADDASGGGGADFILHVADTSGLGVIEAAKEKKIFAFGCISDQNKLAPNTVLTSFVLDVEKTFDHVIKMIQKGNFTGQVFKPGLEAYKGAPGDGIIYIAPFYRLENSIPEEVKIKFNQLEEDIINGKIVVPERYDYEKEEGEL
ncbi:MAG TPA: BMP family protein [Nitrososphaeraceae archaeon]|nr:BMP family protein [Nitrososphaeraceae archaeon]